MADAVSKGLLEARDQKIGGRVRIRPGSGLLTSRTAAGMDL
jgi:hypothetical protein